MKNKDYDNKFQVIERDLLKTKLLEYETRLLNIKSLVNQCDSLLIDNDELVKILALIGYFSDFNQFVFVG